MTRRTLKAGLAVAGYLFVIVPAAFAQNYRPPVSPYLNLRRPGNVGLNYYNLVRPEIEFRNAYQGLQGQFRQQETALQNLQAEVLPSTGHSPRFLNLGSYYRGLAGGSGGGGIGGGIGGGGIGGGGIGGGGIGGGAGVPVQGGRPPTRR